MGCTPTAEAAAEAAEKDIFLTEVINMLVAMSPLQQSFIEHVVTRLYEERWTVDLRSEFAQRLMESGSIHQRLKVGEEDIG